MTTIVDLIRERKLDAELASLLARLVADGVSIHVVSPDASRTGVVATLRDLAPGANRVTESDGEGVGDVLRQPVPLRPATGAVVVLDTAGRVVAAHLLRPPLRDGAGHVRSQGPAVLAIWDSAADAWEHFAWGVLPELGAATHRKAGDLEALLEVGRSILDGLVARGTNDPSAIRAALASWSGATDATPSRRSH